MIDYSKKLFLQGYSYGAVATPYFSTDIVTTQSGFEQRNANWLYPLHEFNVTYDVVTQDMKTYIKNFWAQHRGRLISFKFKDYSDFYCDVSEGTINDGEGLNGMPFAELFKVYQIDYSFDSTFRRIRIIRQSQDENDNYDYEPFKVYFDNILKTDLKSIDYDKGVINFNPLSSFNSENISNEANCIITTITDHDFETDDKIYLTNATNGQDKINDRLFTITKIDDRRFYLNFSTLNMGQMGNATVSKYPQNQKNSEGQLERITVTWQGNFYCKVRFSEDSLPIELNNFNIFRITTKLTEIK